MFTSLPMVDMAPLHATKPSVEELQVLSKQLHEVFRTTGFAYLINPPLSFSHDDVFSIAKEFFSMDEEEKMKVAKDTFRKQNSNTYRGLTRPTNHNKSTLLILPAISLRSGAQTI